METSARNQLKGRITSVRTDAIKAEVEVAVDAAEMIAVIRRGSVEKLGLREGDAVSLIIKSTEVMIGKE